MGRFFRYPLWRKFINRLALAGVCHFEHSEKSRRDSSSLCSVGMTPLGKLQHTSRKFSNSSRNFQFPRTQKLKYPRIRDEISVDTWWNIRGYLSFYTQRSLSFPDFSRRFFASLAEKIYTFSLAILSRFTLSPIPCCSAWHLGWWDSRSPASLFGTAKVWGVLEKLTGKNLESYMG